MRACGEGIVNPQSLSTPHGPFCDPLHPTLKSRLNKFGPSVLDAVLLTRPRKGFSIHSSHRYLCVSNAMPFSHHSHSGQFCPEHAKDTLEDVVRTAISKDMQVLALTEHMPRGERDLYLGEVRSRCPERHFAIVAR